MKGSKNKNYYAILMAGGVGSRFWPSSKASNPKQFIDILGVGETLFQATFKRLSKLIPHENIYVLTNTRYVEMIKVQVPNIQDEQIVPEPEMRNTAPSILLGAMKIYDKNENASIVVAPSDHWIKEEDEFIDYLTKAFKSAGENEQLITLGIQPTFANTGYGYIKYNKEDRSQVKKVERFTEKPGQKQAERFLKEGNYVWNAGIFIWNARFILENFKEHLPEMYRLFEKGKELWNTEKEKEFLKNNYANAANISIDYGIMEKSDSVYVIPVDFHWSDLGTWTSVQGELPTDEIGNTAVNCNLVAEESENNIISTSAKKIVVLKGISDYIIVEDKDVLMIVPKSDEQDIKNIREKVMAEYGEDLG